MPKKNAKRSPKKHLKKRLIIPAAGLMLAAGVAYAATHHRAKTQVQKPASSIVSKNSYTPPAPTKTLRCVAVKELPDSACTPGSVIPTATKEQICVPGYSASVRNVPLAKKLAVYAKYGVVNHITGKYEVDHLISLQLGGSNDIANLWPEVDNPTLGFHQKDAFENKLHADVCAGSISLGDAQKEIATDWSKFYTAK